MFYASNSIEVALYWYPATEHVRVTVLSSKTRHRSNSCSPTTDNALDVFAHPYAYAAHRGVVFEPAYVFELVAA